MTVSGGGGGGNLVASDRGRWTVPLEDADLAMPATMMMTAMKKRSPKKKGNEIPMPTWREPGIKVSTRLSFCRARDFNVSP